MALRRGIVPKAAASRTNDLQYLLTPRVQEHLELFAILWQLYIGLPSDQDPNAMFMLGDRSTEYWKLLDS